jgi:hypothetical protein
LYVSEGLHRAFHWSVFSVAVPVLHLQRAKGLLGKYFHRSGFSFYQMNRVFQCTIGGTEGSVHPWRHLWTDSVAASAAMGRRRGVGDAQTADGSHQIRLLQYSELNIYSSVFREPCSFDHFCRLHFTC